MWQALIPVIANLVAKNNPKAGGAINTAAQMMSLFKAKQQKKPPIDDNGPTE